METTGYVAPDSPADARDRYTELAPIGRELARTVARAMAIDDETFLDTVDESVERAAQNTLFASLLTVSTGTRERFDEWVSEPPYREYACELEGHDQVAHVAWHAAPAAETVVAATYAEQPAAARSMVRRIAWGQYYEAMVGAI